MQASSGQRQSLILKLTQGSEWSSEASRSTLLRSRQRPQLTGERLRWKADPTKRTNSASSSTTKLMNSRQRTAFPRASATKATTPRITTTRMKTRTSAVKKNSPPMEITPRKTNTIRTSSHCAQVKNRNRRAIGGLTKRSVTRGQGT